MLTRLFFLITGKEFLDFRESRLTRPPDNRPIVSGIIVTGHSAAQRLLSVDCLLLHGGRGPHTRRTDADAAKQRTVAYQSGRGRGNRCFCRRELITIVTPLSRSSSAKRPLQSASTVYIGNKKDHCSQPRYSRHQMCRPPAMSADRPAASDSGPVVSRTRHPVGDRVPPSRCTSAF